MQYRINTHRDPSNGRNGIIEVVDALTGERFHHVSAYIGKTMDCAYAVEWCEACVIADTLNFNVILGEYLDAGMDYPKAHSEANEAVAKIRYDRMGPVPECV